MVAILGIIYELIKGFVLLLPNMIKLIDAVVEYYVGRNQRLKAAEAAEKAAKKLATDKEIKNAMANIQASKALRDEGWKINLQQITTMLYEKRQPDLLIKMQNCDWAKVNELYNSDKSIEVKAFQMVEMLRASIN